MRKTLKAEAIVLKKRTLPNRDLVVIMFSKESGKIAVIAKGVKKITSRRLPHIQTGNLLKTVLSISNDRYYLQSSQLKSSFLKIKSNESKIEKMYNYLFVLERLLPELQAEPKIYNLSLSFLVSLSKDVLGQEEMLGFLNQLLKLLGYTHEDLTKLQIHQKVEELIQDKVPFLMI